MVQPIKMKNCVNISKSGVLMFNELFRWSLFLDYYEYHKSLKVDCKELEWELLQLHRKIARVTMIHKIVNGQAAIPEQKFLQPVKRYTRNLHTNMTKAFQRPTGTKDCWVNSFSPIPSKTGTPFHNTSSTSKIPRYLSKKSPNTTTHLKLNKGVLSSSLSLPCHIAMKLVVDSNKTQESKEGGSHHCGQWF